MIESRRFHRLADGTRAVFALEIRRHLRSRGALVATFVAPIAISAIVVGALGSTDEPAPSRIGWVALDDGPTALAFATDVVGGGALEGIVEWEELPSVDAARTAVADERLGAAIVIGPSGASPRPALQVVADEDPLAAGVAATIVDELTVGHAAAVLAFEHGVAVPPVGSEPSLRAPGGRHLDAAVHWGPALGAFLVLLAMGHAAHRQVDDRLRSVGSRMGASMTPRAALVIGRALAATALGAAALVIMALGTQLLFGRSWGPVPVVLAVVGATALAVAGLGALVATVARTAGQAQTLTAVVSFALAIGGGSFTPPGASDPSAGLTRWLPTSQSLDGFSAAATTGAFVDAAPAVLALGATGCVLLLLAAVSTTTDVAA